MMYGLDQLCHAFSGIEHRLSERVERSLHPAFSANKFDLLGFYYGHYRYLEML